MKYILLISILLILMWGFGTGRFILDNSSSSADSNDSSDDSDCGDSDGD